MLNRIADGREVSSDFSRKFKIKRMGKDKDDIFWQIGKIHGLENLAFVSDEDIAAANGNPILLQSLCDRANDAPRPNAPASFDKVIENVRNSLDNYERAVDNLYPGKVYEASDRKKLLALPFLLAKKVELPEPKRGQKEYDLFRELYGKNWDHYEGVNFDSEEKITEFNYEQYIDKHLLAGIDTRSQDFKNTVKSLNLQTRTAMEQHDDNKESFKQMMPILTTLDEEETEIFLHMVRNKGRQASASA